MVASELLKNARAAEIVLCFQFTRQDGVSRDGMWGDLSLLEQSLRREWEQWLPIDSRPPLTFVDWGVPGSSALAISRWLQLWRGLKSENDLYLAAHSMLEYWLSSPEGASGNLPTHTRLPYPLYAQSRGTFDPTLTGLVHPELFNAVFRRFDHFRGQRGVHIHVPNRISCGVWRHPRGDAANEEGPAVFDFHMALEVRPREGNTLIAAHTLLSLVQTVHHLHCQAATAVRILDTDNTWRSFLFDPRERDPAAPEFVAQLLKPAPIRLPILSDPVASLTPPVEETLVALGLLWGTEPLRRTGLTALTERTYFGGSGSGESDIVANSTCELVRDDHGEWGVFRCYVDPKANDAWWWHGQTEHRHVGSLPISGACHELANRLMVRIHFSAEGGIRLVPVSWNPAGPEYLQQSTAMTTVRVAGIKSQPAFKHLSDLRCGKAESILFFHEPGLCSCSKHGFARLVPPVTVVYALPDDYDISFNREGLREWLGSHWPYEGLPAKPPPMPSPKT